MHAIDLDAIEVAAGAGVDRSDLILDPQRVALLLVERLHEPGAAVERGLGVGVEVGSELSERLELAVLRELQAQPAGHLPHGRRLRRAAHARHRDADVDGGPHARAEQVRLEEDLAVGDRDDVRRDVRRHVARLRLDDRQSGERAGAVLVGQLHRPLEQARVQVEDVARVCLAARRAAEQQRHLAIRVRVLRQVVVDRERVLLVVEPVLGDRGARVRREELDRRRLVGRRGDDHGVVERAGVVELLRHLDHGGHPLPHRDVDALQVLVLVVDDRVDADRRLAGLTVADDQLALAATDVRHGVDRLDARLHRLLHRLAVHHPGSLELGRTGLVRLDVALAVERAAERVDDAAEQRVTHRHLEQAPGALHLIALLDLVPGAEQHGADVVRLEVQREPGHVVRQLEELARHDVVEAVDARDAVRHGQHGAHL